MNKETEGHEQPKEQSHEQQYILATDGTSFKTQRAANFTIAQKKIDPEIFKVVPFVNLEGKKDGYQIINSEYGVPSQYRGYWRVKFHPKSSPNETDDVHLPVNGETLVVQREAEVVMPGRFLESADHATYPHFKQVPNKPRKLIGTIKTYNYDRLGQATKEEFLKIRAEGNKTTQENIKRYGFDFDPEEVNG